MKTFNKTLIAAATITTFGLAAAPAAVALDASASVSTSYLWRGMELGSGTPAVTGDLSYSTGGLTVGLWVSSGDTTTGYTSTGTVHTLDVEAVEAVEAVADNPDTADIDETVAAVAAVDAVDGDLAVATEANLSTGTEYDFYASYSGSVGGLGYSIGWAQYNYQGSSADIEEMIYGLSYGPASITVYDNADNDYEYTVIGYEAGAYSFAYGDETADNGDERTHFDVSYAVNDSLSFTVSKPEDEDAIVVASYSLPF
jgi:hypothetical protein